MTRQSKASLLFRRRPLWWLSPPSFPQLRWGHYGRWAVCHLILQGSCQRKLLFADWYLLVMSSKVPCTEIFRFARNDDESGKESIQLCRRKAAINLIAVGDTFPSEPFSTTHGPFGPVSLWYYVPPSPRSSVGRQKESALMGRLGALLCPTCTSYAGCAQWTIGWGAL